MELRQLRYALAVARHSNFTRAAGEVAIAQPALSQQIATLERDLGVRLFDRTNRRVRLTDAGRAFITRAERMVADAEALAEEMTAFAGGLRGRVVVGTNQTVSEYMLPKQLGAFHARYPGIEIALREGVKDDVLSWLDEGSIDLFIGDLREALIDESEFAIEHLYEDEIALAVSPDHPLANCGTITFAELRDERFIMYSPGSAMTERAKTLAYEAGFTPRIAFESVDTLTVRALVAERLGIALFPRTFGNTPGPNVALVSLMPRVARRMSLVTRRTTYAPSAKMFIDFIREHMQTL